MLVIAALTALHVAVMALIDVLSGAKTRLAKLGWSLVILCLPLVGAMGYYMHAGKGAKRSRRSAARPAEGQDEGRDA